MKCKEEKMEDIRFEVVKRFEDSSFQINLPQRQTYGAAGYDFEAAEDITIPPLYEKRDHKPTLVSTGVKAIMPNNVALIIANRSSGPKRGLVLANGVGLIDSDFANSTGSDGEIMFAYYNISNALVSIKKGERIGQGYFQHVLFIKGDEPAQRTREDGFGHTQS